MPRPHRVIQHPHTPTIQCSWAQGTSHYHTVTLTTITPSQEMLVDIAVMEKVAEILNTMREVTNTVSAPLTPDHTH